MLDAAVFRSRAFAPAVVACLTVAVCSYGLSAREIWQDELATWWAARLPLPALWRLLGHVDAVLATYYLWMRGWIMLAGDSPAALRLPSACGMGLCAALIVVLGRRLLGGGAGVWAGLVFAVIPSVSRYGQEARPYAFTLAFSTLSVLLLVRARDVPQSRARWAAYAASLVSVGMLHLIALSNLVAHAALLRSHDEPGSSAFGRRQTIAIWALTVLGALLVLSPLLAFALTERAQIDWAEELSTSLLELPRKLFRSRRLGLLLTALAWLALHKPNRERAALLVWATLPPLLAWLTHPTLHFYVHRYLLFTVPAYCLLGGALLDDVSRALAARRPWLGLALPACVLVVLVVLGVRGHRVVRRGKEEGRFRYNLVATRLIERARPGDAVTFGGGEGAYWTRLALAYYAHGRAIPSDPFVRRSAAEVGWFAPEECEEPASCLSSGVTRLWVMTSAPATDLFFGMPGARARLLRERFQVETVVPCAKMTLALLVPRGGG